VQSDLRLDDEKVSNGHDVMRDGVECGRARGYRPCIDILTPFLQFSSRILNIA
jgi:hypothetical protein